MDKSLFIKYFIISTCELFAMVQIAFLIYKSSGRLCKTAVLNTLLQNGSEK